MEARLIELACYTGQLMPKMRYTSCIDLLDTLPPGLQPPTFW